MNKYAIVMTATKGLLEIMTAAFNGIELYGNEVDIHILAPDLPQWYKDQMPENYIFPDWDSIVCDPEKPEHKKLGWQVRFYRYLYAEQVMADQYDAIMLLDADVFVVGNFMEHFDKVVGQKKLIMPKNPAGSSIAAANLDVVKGAASPPFHCHPFFFDGKVHRDLLKDVYKWGKEEDYGDMATLYRTLFRRGEVDLVEGLNNDLWCFTFWHFSKVENTRDEQHRPLLLYDNEQMVVVHRRWNQKDMREKFVGDLKGPHIEPGTHNAEVFKDTIDWLNENGPFEWEEEKEETE